MKNIIKLFYIYRLRKNYKWIDKDRWWHSVDWIRPYDYFVLRIRFDNFLPLLSSVSITIQRHTKSITTCETWNRIPDHRKFTYSKRRERARNVHIPLQRSQEVSLNDRSPTLTFPHKLVISGGDAKQIFISFIIILQRTVTITWEVLSFTYRSGEATAPPWAPAWTIRPVHFFTIFCTIFMVVAFGQRRHRPTWWMRSYWIRINTLAYNGGCRSLSKIDRDGSETHFGGESALLDVLSDYLQTIECSFNTSPRRPSWNTVS